MRRENVKLKPGLSGIMRVKNEAQFIPKCIESCLDALDELIIVYNDCTDESEEVINRYQELFPEKIKAFRYPYRVFSQGLSKEEFEEVMSFPDDSPHLLCNYYNFALEKVQFSHALKIDADQIYYRNEISRWRNLAKQKTYRISLIERIIGGIVFNTFRTYRLISIKRKRVVKLPMTNLHKRLYSVYRKYVEYCFVSKNACPSISGVNIYKDGESYVTLGCVSDKFNILPPFNGEGDHLVFKVSEKTYYKKFIFDFYNKLRNSRYSVIEVFEHPYKVMPYGFGWFHINSMRSEYKERNRLAFHSTPEKYMEVRSFLSLNYEDVLRITDKEMFSLYQRILFRFLFDNDKRTIEDNVNLIDNIPS